METPAIRAGLIGLGAIGQDVVRMAPEHGIEIVGALVRDVNRERVPGSPPVVGTLSELLTLDPDVVVEAAGHEALREFGPGVLRAGYDLLFLAVGALAEPVVGEELRAAAEEGGSQAKVISGAIGGLDALAAAAVGGLDRVTHTTRKPATTLLSADEAAGLTEAKEIFRGSAREGALEFPTSVNVAAAVSVAGLGLDQTELRVLADPAVTRNQHEVEVEGSFGRFRFSIEGFPSEDNPRTGKLVAMSVIHQLKLRRAPLGIG